MVNVTLCVFYNKKITLWLSINFRIKTQFVSMIYLSFRIWVPAHFSGLSFRLVQTSSAWPFPVLEDSAQTLSPSLADPPSSISHVPQYWVLPSSWVGEPPLFYHSPLCTLLSIILNSKFKILSLSVTPH